MNHTRERLAFDRYWALGPERSLVALERDLREAGDPVARRTLESWSVRFDWQKRIADLERQAREAADEARLAAIREMNARHAKEGILLQQRGAEWIQALNAGDVSAEAAVRSIVEGARLERLGMGEGTSRTVVSDEDPKLKELSDEQLDHLLRLAATANLEGEVAPQS